MVFYALIFLYTPRKSKDFNSEKIHGQIHLKNHIAKCFGSRWIRQASHFGGKLNNSLKDLRQIQSLLVHSGPGWHLTRDFIQRESDSPFPHTRESGVVLLTGMTQGYRAECLMGLIFGYKWWHWSYATQGMNIIPWLQEKPPISPFFFSPLPCCDLKEILEIKSPEVTSQSTSLHYLPCLTFFSQVLPIVKGSFVAFEIPSLSTLWVMGKEIVRAEQRIWWLLTYSMNSLYFTTTFSEIWCHRLIRNNKM